MKIKTLISIFQLSILYTIAITANADSSATAFTTISANIVPAASFSVSTPVLLAQQTANVPLASATNHAINTSTSKFSNSILLRTPDGQSPVKFMVKSSQNLAYDVSISSHTSDFDNTGSINENINHTLDAHVKINIHEEHEMYIDGSMLNASEKNTGTNHGLIGITVNYN